MAITNPIIASISSSSVTEGDALLYTVKLSETSIGQTEVKLSINRGKSTAAADQHGWMEISYDGGGTFTSVPRDGLITVPGNTSQFVIRVATVADTVAEADATVVLNAVVTTDPSQMTGEGVGTIVDNDTPRSIEALYDARSNEGDYLVFDMTVAGNNGQSLPVNLAIEGGTAAAGRDFTNALEVSYDNGTTWAAAGSQITVPGNVANVKLRISTQEDTIIEGVESLTLKATANGEEVQASGVILDDDLAAITAVSTARAEEGNSMVFDVTLNGTTSQSATMNLRLAATSGPQGTNATLGTDNPGTMAVSFDNGATFTPVSATGEITVPANVSSYKVRVDTTEDTKVELDETFTLQARWGESVQSNTGTIQWDDLPTLGISSPTAIEGAPVDFDVQITNVDFPQRMAFTLQSGTATVGTDVAGTYSVSYNGGGTWTTVSGSDLTVPANTSSFKIRVAGMNDNVYEGNESFTLKGEYKDFPVSNTGTATITDEADLPKVTSINNASANEGESMTFTVTLSNASLKETPVNLNLSNGSAVAGADFSTSLQVSFNGGASFQTVGGPNTWVSVPPNTTSFQVRVNTVEDWTYESTESFTLSASANGGADTGSGTIYDDDFSQFSQFDNFSQFSQSFRRDPMVLDLDNDGIETTDLRDKSVLFDMDDDGVRDRTAWISGDDGFLVYDRNNNGKIDAHAEMFGGDNAGDGYRQLQAFDTNQDGKIAADDAGYHDLKVWQDRNENGLTDDGEMFGLSEAGLQALRLQSQTRLDEQHGNLLGDHSLVDTASGGKIELAEVWLEVKTEQGHDDSDEPDQAAAPAMPDVKLHTVFNDVPGEHGSVDQLLGGRNDDAGKDIGHFDDNLKLNNMLHHYQAPAD